MKVYKNCLKNPLSKVRNFFVGGFAFIVSWIVTPRGSSHSTLSEDDLLLIYYIMNKVKLNWIHIFKDHMQKAIRLSAFHYPYAILISKFLHYFEVDIEEELAEIVKPSSEINSGFLSKMGFTKIGGRWVSKDGDQTGSSGTHDKEETEDATNLEEPAVETHGVVPSTYHMGERTTSMSPFERLMVNQMDNFVENQRNIHELCESRFQHMDSRFQTLDEQIEEVQNQLLDL